MSDFLTISPKNLFNNIFNFTNELLVNIYETDNFYNVEYFLAGISKENIELTFENNCLTLNIKTIECEDKNYIKEEYIYPSGLRKLTFFDVDYTKTQTNYIDGKLCVQLRKTTTTPSNVITIK